MYRKVDKRRVRYIGQLFHNNRYLTVQEVAQRRGHYAGIYLNYFAVTNAVKQEWKQVMLNAHILFNQEPDTNLQNINLVKLSNKQLRKLLVEQRGTNITSIDFWERKYNISIYPYFAAGIEACRLQLLHFKILHNIYPTNILLHKMKIKDSALCDHCKVHDFIEHFFYKCNKLRGFWSEVLNYIYGKTEIIMCIDEKVALFGVLKADLKSDTKQRTLNNINTILLVAKMCISKARYGKSQNLKLTFEIEMGIIEKYLK